LAFAALNQSELPYLELMHPNCIGWVFSVRPEANLLLAIFIFWLSGLYNLQVLPARFSSFDLVQVTGPRRQ